MKKFIGGSKVPGGFYWNSAKWDITTVSGDEGVLEGTASDRYVKVPLVTMVVLAVAVSFLFVVFLPFIGFALLVYALVKAVGLVGAKTAQTAAGAVAPGWQPGEAHFSGRPEDVGGEAKRDGDQALTSLEQEIAAKRDEERK